MSTAVSAMPRKKSASPVELEGVKIEKHTLDLVRIAFTWTKSKMPEDQRVRFTLAGYLSQCIRGERSFPDDYANYIREEAKRIGR